MKKKRKSSSKSNKVNEKFSDFYIFIIIDKKIINENENENEPPPPTEPFQYSIQFHLQRFVAQGQINKISIRTVFV